MQTPFLGSIPIDPQMADACDEGNAFIQQYAASPTAAILREILKPIEALDAQDTKQTVNPKTVEDKTMKIAIPLADGKLAAHFGHCERFALLEVDLAAHKILKREEVEAPPHQPGLLPPWLAERGTNLIIAAGMGQRAQGLFAEQGIQVVVGASAEIPERLVADYLAGTLAAGENVCDH
jgi:ATP-binding protein involved in chromosome partitioning